MVDKIKEILKQQYGIKNEEEFNEAVEKSKGINIGIFTKPLCGRSLDDGQNEEREIA